MADTDDFIEGGDPFDPAWVEEYTSRTNQETSSQNDDQQMYLRNRRRYYNEVFSTGETSKAALDFVMRDLATFCRAYSPTFDLNSKLQDLKEGRREVYMRIMDHTVLSHEEQFRKYVNAQTGNQS